MKAKLLIGSISPCWLMLQLLAGAALTDTACKFHPYQATERLTDDCCPTNVFHMTSMGPMQNCHGSQRHSAALHQANSAMKHRCCWAGRLACSSASLHRCAAASCNTNCLVCDCSTSDWSACMLCVLIEVHGCQAGRLEQGSRAWNGSVCGANEWHGVSCTDGRVSGIDLEGFELTGVHGFT